MEKQEKLKKRIEALEGMLVKEDQVVSDAKAKKLRKLIDEFLESKEIQEAKIVGYFSLNPPPSKRGGRGSGAVSREGGRASSVASLGSNVSGGSLGVKYDVDVP